MLYVLLEAKPILRKVLLTHCDDGVIKMINEILFNLMRGNLALSNEQLKKLNKCKTPLRSIIKSCKGKCLKKKRRIFVKQSGGSALAIALATAGQIIIPYLIEKATQFVQNKFYSKNSDSSK